MSHNVITAFRSTPFGRDGAVNNNEEQNGATLVQLSSPPGSERKPRAELHLERVRNRGCRGESTQIADGFVVGSRLIRSRPVLVTKVGPVQYIVELCENGQPLASRQREILGHPGVRVDERQPARVVDADWLSI